MEDEDDDSGEESDLDALAATAHRNHQASTGASSIIA